MTDERLSPRRYRIRVFEDNYELLADQNHLAWLDLESEAGFRRAQTELEALRRSLIELGEIPQKRRHLVRLTVHSHPDGNYVMDWTQR